MLKNKKLRSATTVFLCSIVKTLDTVPSFAQPLEAFFLSCESPQFSQDFRLEPLTRSVTLLGYNQSLEVQYWAGEAINTAFPLKKTIKDFVAGAEDSDFTHFNFDRIAGKLTVVGLGVPTEDDIKQCRLDNKEDWFCQDHRVTSLHTVDCSIVNPKF